VKVHPFIMAWGIMGLAMSGCAGKGEVVLLDIPTPRPTAVATKPASAGLRIAVEPFEDSRSAQARLGTRSHLWGGESYFAVPGGSPSDATTLALVQFLNAKGWQTRRVKPGTQADNSDITISGRALALSVDAKSQFGSTKLTAGTKLAMHALNHADGSTVRMTLNGAGSDSVFWFEPEDAQQLINAVLEDSFGQLLQNTKVEGKVLRLRD
jgi:hypothetical protein